MTESKKPSQRRNTPDLATVGAKDKDAKDAKDATKLDADLSPMTVRITPPSERWENDHDLARTVKMDAAPVTVPRPARTSRATDAPRSAADSGIEMLVIDEKQTSGGERRPWRAAEVWTKRRVYGLDSTFRCVEILDRETGRPELTHEMLGARLGGGRMRDPDAVRFSYPLPLPGMEAMFSKGKKHGYTSAVERMVVRIRVLHTTADETAPSWDDIASRWSEPPPRP
ncbi:MAG: hypothetical protein JWO86_1139 [Myxococcaceae bacterium]|nr:hypothetical protein [Myxococcaceae bacterium]